VVVGSFDRGGDGYVCSSPWSSLKGGGGCKWVALSLLRSWRGASRSLWTRSPESSLITSTTLRSLMYDGTRWWSSMSRVDDRTAEVATKVITAMVTTITSNNLIVWEGLQVEGAGACESLWCELERSTREWARERWKRGWVRECLFASDRLSGLALRRSPIHLSIYPSSILSTTLMIYISMWWWWWLAEIRSL